MDDHVKKINRSLVTGWLLIVLILAVAYIMEVVKGERSISYLVIFMIFTVAPASFVLVRYLRKPDRFSLRYEIVMGYFVMYCFVMITGNTTMVFSYILPMLSLLVLFHQPKLILLSGVGSFIVNIISIYMRYTRGELNTHNSKDVEIQIALLFLCFMGAYLATKLYDEIHTKNMEFTEELTAQNEEIRQQNEEIERKNNEITAQNEEIRLASEELERKNNEITAQNEEIRLASEELERKNDEIIAQNEKITAQNEEIADINEELTAQNEEIRAMNEEIIQRNEDMEQMTLQTITTIANTIDAKDEYTRGHSRRVAEYSAAIAKEIGYKDSEIADVRFIGLLHDIGKIGIPDAVLNKPGRLTNEEYQVMKSHTTVGAEILKDIDMIKGLDIGAKYHHERADGKGYPEGLQGEQIPMIARIIAVADAYDAMSSNRVYRRHLDEDKVLSELRKGVGTQWDAECAKAMIKLIEEKRLPKVNTQDDAQMVKQATTILSRVIDYAEDKGGELTGDLDDLTATFGRERGRAEIQNAIGECGHGSLFIFDIDHFHRINETEGFVVGDHYLKVMVELIRACADNLVIARFGADEFVVYNRNADTEEAAEAFARQFFTLLEDRISVDERIRNMTVSVGATEIMTEKDQVMVLYEHADKAIYVAKQQKGNAFYCHKLAEDIDSMNYMEAVDLKQLIEFIQDRERYKGCMLAGYPEFSRMYEYISNIADRNEQQVQIILFTLKSVNGIKVTVEERDRIMNLLQNAIINSIRNVDVSTRYSSTQFAVLLMDNSSKETEGVATRIMTEFYRTYDKREVELHYDSADLSNKPS